MYTKSASVSFDQMESDIWLFSNMGEKLWTPTKNRRVLGVVLLCPWNFPGKNSGVVCHFLLQGIFLTQGLNFCLLHWRADSLPLHHLES